MRALAVCAVMALVAAGCGGDRKTAMKLDWDLSSSHTLGDVDWPDASLSAHEWTPIDSVRIRFSGGRTLNEKGVVRRVGGEREGDVVSAVLLYSHPLTAGDAYRLALRWCREWHLPPAAIDEWHDAGAKTFLATAYNPREKLGPNHPEPSVKILSSFLDDKPVVVSLRFGWIRQP
jgi:hypothetical protein